MREVLWVFRCYVLVRTVSVLVMGAGVMGVVWVIGVVSVMSVACVSRAQLSWV